MFHHIAKEHKPVKSIPNAYAAAAHTQNDSGEHSSLFSNQSFGMEARCQRVSSTQSRAGMLGKLF